MVFITVFIANSIYFYIVNNHLDFLKEKRVYIAIFFDVFSTFLTLYLVDIFSPFLSFLFIWFIVGYGTKYGLKAGIFATICVNIAWMLLISYSPFWRENTAVAIGWLLTFLFIPPYFLRLIYKLQKQFEALNTNYNKTEYEAKYDYLTKLLNRNYFEKNLLKFISRSIENDKSFAILFIDLDGFKNVNDKYGHDIGDRVLIEVANRLKMLQSDDNEIISRIGGDEFAIIMDYTSKEDLQNKALNIINLLSKPYENDIHILSASIGISVYPDDASTVSKLKKYADVAMYNAKQEGKGRFYFYSDIASAKSA
jgi:diguanylate cyclase (GGDEF)-like protein